MNLGFLKNLFQINNSMKKKIKIGIIKNIDSKMSSYQFDIFNHIISNQNLELSYILSPTNTESYNPQKFFFFKIISFIERKLFGDLNYYPFNELINGINIFEFTASLDRFYHKVDQKTCDEIKNFNLDIILRFDLNILIGEILNTAKYGVWSFHHGDNNIIRGSSPCFFEIVKNKKYTHLILQKLNNSLDGGDVLCRGSIITHPIHIKNLKNTQSLSLDLFIKAVNNIRSNKIKIEQKKIYFSNIYKSPSAYDSFNYVKKLCFAIVKSLRRKFFPYYRNNWSIYHNTGNPFVNPLYNSKLSIGKNSKFFSADPFLYNKGKYKLIFFEKYFKKEKVGFIYVKDLLTMKENKINLSSGHKSFPTIFSRNGNYFLTVESKSNNRLEFYKASKFPHKWELYKTFFHGKKISDPTVFNFQKKLWLSFSCGQYCDSKRYLYLIDKDFNLISHNSNPISLMAETSRNAGNIFKFENKYFRPVMQSSFFDYGEHIDLYEIKKLDLNNYDEVFFQKILADQNELKIHHLSVHNNGYVFDKT